MFWRKRNDGFEWHKYVRTTIKLRREARREMADRVKQQAAEGVKAAGSAAGVAAREGARNIGAGSRAAASGLGKASRAGLHYAGIGSRIAASGAWRFSRASLQYAGAGSRIAISGLGKATRASLHYTGMGSRFAGSKLMIHLRPLIDILGRPGVGTPLAVAGSIAAIAAILRAALARGGDREAAIAFLVGVACLFLAYAPRLWLGNAGRLGEALAKLGPKARFAAASIATVVVLVAGAITFWPSSNNPFPAVASLPLIGTKTIEGRAGLLGPDILRVGTKVVRLDGIEPPERDQFCFRPGGRRWRCGEAASAALARFASGKHLKCDIRGKDEFGLETAVCFDGKTDINAALVRGGYVFARAGLMSRYASLESEAQAAKAGFWNGEADRPEAWRGKIWDAAKRHAPDGCPIKGHVSGGTRTYILPWSADYGRVRVNTARGGRWFCSEQEAIAAGWKIGGRG